MGDLASLKAFAIVILGGLGSIPGATIGGFILAFMEELGAGYISSGFRDGMGFLLIIAILRVQADGAVRAEGADRVRRSGALAACLAFLFSVPLWIGDLYVLHVLIITGIFIIAAMSLNLLLGYTGQLSLGHVAFFGIGAYVSSLVSLGFEVHLLPDWLVTPGAQAGLARDVVGVVIAGLSGWVIGRISFKVRGAYFVIVTVSFAEVVRLVALNWVELTQGPMALNNIPPLRLGVPGLFELSSCASPPTTISCSSSAIVCYVLIRRLVHSRAGRAMIALRENEPLATSVGVDVTQLPGAGDRGVGRDGRRCRSALRPLRAHRRPGRVPVHLHRDDGDHGGHRRQGHAGRADRRRFDLRPAAGDLARAADRARGAVGDLWRADDPGRVLSARGHRAGAARVVAATAAGAGHAAAGSGRRPEAAR